MKPRLLATVCCLTLLSAAVGVGGLRLSSQAAAVPLHARALGPAARSPNAPASAASPSGSTASPSASAGAPGSTPIPGAAVATIQSLGQKGPAATPAARPSTGTTTGPTLALTPRIKVVPPAAPSPRSGRPAPSPTPAQTAPAPATPGEASIGILRLDGDFSSASDPARYQYVILNSWESGDIPALKAANPGIKVLVYEDMSSTRSDGCVNGVDDTYLPTGVGYCYANTNDPGWFLTDTTGARINWNGYPTQWQMDVGNTAYQATWLHNVEATLKAGGWDGIELDNTMASVTPYLSPGQTIAKYPTDAGYQAATQSFLAGVAAPLVSAGFTVIPNISGAGTALWTQWIGYASGGMEEWFTNEGMQQPGQEVSGEDWSAQMALMTATEAQGKTFLGVTYGSLSDGQALEYARASFLVEYTGGPSALIEAPGTGVDPWSTQWTIGIGAPQGPAYQAGAAWRHDFTGGTAVVNPSGSLVTVSLGGTYTMPDGTAVTSVTLAPHSGMVLPLG
jgi:hypothetical protein